MNFAAPDSTDERLHRRQLANAANAALRGELHNTGSFIFPAGSNTFTLNDSRLGAGKKLQLVPRNSAAAVLHWWISSMGKGMAVISTAGATSADCNFDYIITGVIAKYEEA